MTTQDFAKVRARLVGSYILWVFFFCLNHVEMLHTSCTNQFFNCNLMAVAYF